MPDDYLIVLTTLPDETTAGQLARRLVEKKLAACVNILGRMTSIYPWEGKIEQGTEHQLVIKTTAQRYAELEAFIKNNHPYRLPEILALPVAGGAADYLDWIEQCTND
ncbi:MAG: divalent-cation tolerance protein CutA [Gammaproteobacteria bacterium]|nr:MAG: divalent-cation tolerance protein CutA [Gammaproteobacteria bacterium]